MRKIRHQKAISVVVALAITLALVGIGVPAHAQTFTPLYAFGAAPNGFDAFPTGTLALGRDGNFYGTTNFNESNVFEITPGGAETLLWDSGQGTGDQCEFDGINNSAPYFGGLTLGGDGNLYGTCWLYTFNTDSGGVIFKFVPSEGQAGFSAFYTFPGPFGASGSYTPENMTLGPDGNLYGTTFGTNDLAQGDVYGSVFKLTSSGTLTTLYSFQDTTDGGNPSGPLALGSDGNFYGTTITGSISGVNTGGTIYRITPQGAFTVLYSFNAASSGPANSYGGVVRGNDGNLYGTTYRGGTFNDGTVFQLAGGVLNVLHSFNQIPDNAAVPQLPLTVGSDGNLYGVASDIAEGGYGPESIFKVTPGGTYTDVFTFPDVATCNTTTADGCIALAPLTQDPSGLFYGTTANGGANEAGVFYSLNVGLPPFVALQFPLGTVGSALGIFGQGFKKATAVSFGGVAATSFSVGSNSYLSARVPVGALYGPVTVTESVGKLKSAHPFAIAPTQNTFSPTSGAVGTPVTINGTGLTEAIKVTFGGVAATTFTVNSDGRITADVPTGAVTGKIVVINKGGPAAASATSFTVN